MKIRRIKLYFTDYVSQEFCIHGSLSTFSLCSFIWTGVVVSSKNGTLFSCWISWATSSNTWSFSVSSHSPKVILWIFFIRHIAMPMQGRFWFEHLAFLLVCFFSISSSFSACWSGWQTFINEQALWPITDLQFAHAELSDGVAMLKKIGDASIGFMKISMLSILVLYV